MVIYLCNVPFPVKCQEFRHIFCRKENGEVETINYCEGFFNLKEPCKFVEEATISAPSLTVESANESSTPAVQASAEPGAVVDDTRSDEKPLGSICDHKPCAKDIACRTCFEYVSARNSVQGKS